jgi:hypothetical protein
MGREARGGRGREKRGEANVQERNNRVCHSLVDSL